MIKRGWIDKTNDVDKLEKNVCEFLGIPSLNSPLPSFVSLRHSQDRDFNTVALNAWVRQIEHISKDREIGHFDYEQLSNAIPEILSCAMDARLISYVPKILQDKEIAFVILPHLPKTYLDGAVIMSGEHPIIGITLRYDRIDSFWFTLMHEIAHIILGHKDILWDDIEEGHGSGAEKEESDANNLAREWLIREDHLSKFIDEVNPLFSKVAIEQFSMVNNRHPGIILGQLHHAGVVDYKHLRSLLVKVSPFLSEWIRN